ncbi:unnamed protein product [Symbiodinium sp. CCMP2456]|nr:unnamed protein product [Symbiodinium sp. CCMP2456]
MPAPGDCHSANSSGRCKRTRRHLPRPEYPTFSLTRQKQSLPITVDLPCPQKTDEVIIIAHGRTFPTRIS